MRLVTMVVVVLMFGGCAPEVQTPRRVVQPPRLGPVAPRRTPPPKPRFADARRFVLTLDADSGRSADFSPDGRMLAVGGTFGRVRLIDLKTGRTLKSFQADDELDRAVHVRFTPGGDHLLAAGYDTCSVKVWHLSTGRLVRTIPVGRAVHGLAIAGAHRVAVATTGWAVVVDWRTGRQQHRVDMPYGLEARHVALNAGGDRLAVSSSVGHLRLVDVGRQETLAQRRVDTARVTALALPPNGKLMAVGLQDGTLQLLQGSALKRVRTFQWTTTEKAVVGLHFSTKARRLTALTADGNLLEIDAATGQVLSRRDIFGSATSSLAVSPDGLLAVAPRTDRRLALWQSKGHAANFGLATRPLPRPAGPRPTLKLAAPTQTLLTLPSGRIVSLALSSKGTRLVLGHQPHAVSAWTLRSKPKLRFVRLWRRRVLPLRGTQGKRALRVALSTRNRFVYLHGPSERLRRYSLAGGWPTAMRPTRLPSARAVLRSLLPTPNGRSWITTTNTAQVHLWSSLGVRQRSFKAMKNPYWVGVSPDSKRFVEVGGVDDVEVYNLRTGKRLWQHRGHPHRMLEVMALRFAPDSKQLLSYHRSGFLRIFDAATGRRVDHRRIRTPPGLTSCALRPDTRVLACAVGSAIRLYEVATGALIRVVRPKTSVSSILGLGYSQDGSTLIVMETARQIRLLRFQ